jgi:ElaB/YqjD/DUF883 family membrane-anchored ribosome-binding protein
MPNNLYDSIAGSAAETAHDLAGKLADSAADVQHKLSTIGRRAADAIDENVCATTAYVREHDGSRMLHDLKRVVRYNPGPSLLVAAAVGFLVGRTVARYPAEKPRT